MAPKTKTETIKARSIYVYLPSEEMVDDWKEKAKSSGLSISKFVQEHVEKSMNYENEDTFVSRGELDQVDALTYWLNMTRVSGCSSPLFGGAS